MINNQTKDDLENELQNLKQLIHDYMKDKPGLENLEVHALTLKDKNNPQVHLYGCKICEKNGHSYLYCGPGECP